MLNLSKKEVKIALSFAIPAAILIGVYYLVPASVAIMYSFTNKALLGTKSIEYDFVGVANYIRLLKDPRFYRAAGKTIYFLFFGSIVGNLGAGFIIAYMMRDVPKWVQKLAGVLILASWLVPQVVVAFIFNILFNIDGALNAFLSLISGADIYINWFDDFPEISVIIASVWKGTAFSVLLFQSAINGVDKTMLEAAFIDGAGRWKRLWYIIIPSIKGTIVTATILTIIRSIGGLGLLFVMTGGGPNGKTTTLPIFMYNEAFSSHQIGYGTAISIIILILGLGLSKLYVKLARHEF